jgi:protoporphyrinogen oxidase
MLNFLILGAGPSGLSFAHRLMEIGEESFLILEKEAEAGGLCRSRTVDGSALDIGGGHLLDTRRKDVLEFLFKFLPRENWNHFQRYTTICINHREVNYPLESNLYQLSEEDQVEHLCALAQSGEQQGKPKPTSFDEWIHWKFGSKIAEDYMIPYNKKIWSIDLNNLGTNWLYKLPTVNFRDIIKSCITKKPQGKIPAHNEFLYPKEGGYGKLWEIAADQLGEKIKYNQKIQEIGIDSRLVKTGTEQFSARQIISTIPWNSWLGKANIPSQIESSIRKLQHTSLEVGYYRENLKSDAHWIYIPDESVPHHRILNRRTFVMNSRGYWTETNMKRVEMPREKPEWNFVNDFAYPIDTIEKPKAIKSILEWASSKDIHGLGRWGRWEHMNSDVAVQEAFALVDELRGKER